MLLRDHIVSVAAKDGPAPPPVTPGSLDATPPERLAPLIDRVAEGLDYGQSAGVDALLAQLLALPCADDAVRVRLLDLALKATDFVQRWFQRLFEKRLPEKHRLQIAANRHFRVELGPGTVAGAAELARASLGSSNADIALKAHCLLESLGFAGRREGDVRFFVAYVFAEHAQGVLAEWCAQLGASGAALDGVLALRRFFTPDIPLADLLAQEIRRLPDHAAAERVLVSLRSHGVVAKLLTTLFARAQRLRTGLGALLAATFKAEDAAHTRGIFGRLFRADPARAEEALKDFIARTRSPALADVFYARCWVVDSAFVEACLVCRDGVGRLGERALRLVGSHYLALLTADQAMFEAIALLLPPRVFASEAVVRSFFAGRALADSAVLRKLLFLAEGFAPARPAVFAVFRDIAESVRTRLAGTCRDACDGPVQVAHPLCSASRGYFFGLVAALRGLPAMAALCGLFVAVDGDAFLDCVLPAGTALLDAFFVEAVNAIHRRRQTHPALHAKTRDRLRETPLLHAENYWSEAVREGLEINFDDCVDGDAQTCHGPAFAWNVHRLATGACLAGHLQRCRSPETRSAIRAALDGRGAYAEGLALNKSLVRLRVDARRFCVYGVFHPYDADGPCSLLSLVSPAQQKTCIGVADNRYFVQTHAGPQAGVLLLKEAGGCAPRRAVAIEVDGARGVLHCPAASRAFRAGNVAEVWVGEDFRGVVSRVLLHDTFGYSSALLDDIGRCDFFLHRLRDLEKKLLYAEGAGVYIDAPAPYHLTGRAIAVDFLNVLRHRNAAWRETAAHGPPATQKTGAAAAP